jgi:hypothetical protein
MPGISLFSERNFASGETVIPTQAAVKFAAESASTTRQFENAAALGKFPSPAEINGAPRRNAALRATLEIRTRGFGN